LLIISSDHATLYDRVLVPVMFQPFAEAMAQKIASSKPESVLELAAGTGALTVALDLALSLETRLVATDSQPEMLALGRQRTFRRHVEWRQLDMNSMLLEPGWDVIAVQFGLMFLSNPQPVLKKLAGRLTNSGTLAVAVWDRLSENGLSRVAQEIGQDILGLKDANLFDRPFCMCDCTAMEQVFKEAGFKSIDMQTVRLESTPADPAELAEAFVRTNPIALEMANALGRVDALTKAIEAGFRESFGSPVRAPLSAHLILAGLGSA